MRPDCIFSSHLSSEVTLAATCIFGDQRDFGSRQPKEEGGGRDVQTVCRSLGIIEKYWELLMPRSETMHNL